MKYECHITIDPIHEDEEALVSAVISPHGFKLAELFKRNNEKSTLDSFMSAKGESFHEIYRRMHTVLWLLKHQGYVVRRYKIEEILLDHRPQNGTY